MSSAIMSLLVSHILTFLESELIKAEPAIVAALEQDIQSLMTKLEALISKKSPSVAAVLNPTLKSVSSITQDVVKAAGDVITTDASALDVNQ